VDIRLICPGLFGFPNLDPRSVPPTPALDRLLACAGAHESPPRDSLETLAAAFGVFAQPGGDLATAALCLLAEAPDLVRAGCWLHADPVHLRADRDRLLLFGGPSLGLGPEEAAALVAAFNAHFRADDLTLIAPGPHRWYLRAPALPDIRIQPLHRASGRPLDASVPTGPEARAWNRWQNEAQMLFHRHPVNQAREAAGLPLVSGVWTWGGGTLPKVPGGPELMVADHPLGAGLARASGAHLLGLRELVQSSTIRSAPAQASVLIFWDALWWPALAADREAWCDALAELETVTASLTTDLAAGRVRALLLDDGERWHFALGPWGLRRFWRRHGLRHWLDRSPGANARSGA
jgi:hypothetical protein